MSRLEYFSTGWEFDLRLTPDAVTPNGAPDTWSISLQSDNQATTTVEVVREFVRLLVRVLDAGEGEESMTLAVSDRFDLEITAGWDGIDPEFCFSVWLYLKLGGRPVAVEEFTRQPVDPEELRGVVDTLAALVAPA